MSDGTIKLSLALKEIANTLDKMIEQSAGERIGFTLLVFTEGRASYVSTVKREDSVREIKNLLQIWSDGMPDIPAHEING